jgi:hypothetical protein
MTLVPIAAEFDNNILIRAEGGFWENEGISQLENMRVRLNCVEAEGDAE